MLTVPAKTILSGYIDGDNWFSSNYNINLYRGCCHGCIYCDSRSECYHVDNFDTVRAKENALETLENELRSRRRTGIVCSGSMSDTYNPFEAQLRLTRGSLELFDHYGFGVVCDTKSDLCVRDIDLYRSISRHSPAVVNMTITTADDELCRRIEQRVCVSSSRARALRALSDAGVLCGVMLMPILPFINDTPENILGVVELAATAGARWVFPWQSFGVTLRQNQRIWFYDRIDEQFPGLRDRYIRTFGDSYECTSPRNDELWTLFTRACRERGLVWDMRDIISIIRERYAQPQLSLF